MRSATPILLTLAICLFSFNACQKDNLEPTNANRRLTITVQNQYETPPSKVSVFFKVTDDRQLPVAGLTEADFTLYEKGRNDDSPLILSADEAKRVVSDNKQVFRFHTMLLLDLSGSVLNGSLDQLKAGAKQFVDRAMATSINTSTTIGIWWFDGRDALHPLIDFSANKTDLHEAIDGISPGLSGDSSTDLFGAILKGTQLAETKINNNDLQGVLSAASIIVFTDGTDQAARYSKDDAYSAVKNANEKIQFYTIGLGNEIDETVLKRIGKTSSVFADDTAKLGAKFSEIATNISAEANSYYLFEYCSPKRDGSGMNELHMEIVTDELKGKKIIEFDATGFTDDCSLN